jgi:bacteriorhodopsin
MLGNDISRAYLTCAGILTLTWILYPIAWGCSEGGNRIAPDSEAVFYGILDIFSKIAFIGALLWFHRSIDPARLGLAIRDYDEDPTVTGSVGGEKKRERDAGHLMGDRGGGMTQV